jgi:hypothetical protein
MVGFVNYNLMRDFMAKNKDKANKKADKSKNEDKEAAPEFKFGVQDIADELDIKPASVRVQLRNKGIEKAGKSYGWNTKAELKEVIDQLRSSDDDEKPAKKSSKKGGKGKKGKKDADDE